MDQEEVIEKPKKEKESVFKKIIGFILWVIMIGWICVCLVDYYKTSKHEKPMFCLKQETKKYSDGTVDVCLGAGYKIYNYNRKSINGIEFGPFWSPERNGDNIN